MLIFLLQIINEDNEECADGEEGDLAMKVNPDRPVGLFSRYVVSYVMD